MAYRKTAFPPSPPVSAAAYRVPRFRHGPRPPLPSPPSFHFFMCADTIEHARGQVSDQNFKRQLPQYLQLAAVNMGLQLNAKMARFGNQDFRRFVEADDQTAFAVL